MIKETVKYTNWNGLEVIEDCYFHLNKAELIKLNLTQGGGFDERIKRVYKAKDTKELIRMIDDIICLAYGVKDEDGRRFMKKDANGVPLVETWKETEAYSEILTKCLQDVEWCAKFINGMLPEDMQNQKVDESKVIEALEG